MKGLREAFIALMVYIAIVIGITSLALFLAGVAYRAGLLDKNGILTIGFVSAILVFIQIVRSRP